MRLDQIAGVVFNQLLGRLLRRALMIVIFAICAIVAIYHFSVVGMLALQEQYGALQAHVIFGAGYSAIGLIALVVWWAMRGKSNNNGSIPALQGHQRELQLAMLVEAVMLGYSLARKSPRAN
jgi:hypothetical protein